MCEFFMRHSCYYSDIRERHFSCSCMQMVKSSILSEPHCTVKIKMEMVSRAYSILNCTKVMFFAAACLGQVTVPSERAIQGTFNRSILRCCFDKIAESTVFINCCT